MAGATALEKLEDSIREFVSEVDGEDAVTGWVLSYQTSKLTGNPDLLPLAFSSDFAMGFSTSGELAIGLSSVTVARLKKVLTEDVEPSDD